MDGYAAIGQNDTPLFGQPTMWSRISNWITVGITAVFTILTLLCALIRPQSDSGHPKGTNIFFAFCLLFLGITHLVLDHWYKQGDVDPKFRFLKYANTVLLMMLCICALLYIFDA